MFDVAGQNVLITGGTRGIGKAIAKLFLEQKAHVWVTYQKNHEKALKFQEELHLFGENLKIVACDMQKEGDLQKLFSDLEGQGVQLHIVVNNAGIKKDGLVAQAPEEDWKEVIETNLMGSYRISKLAVLHFLKAKYGRLIHISSLAARLGMKGQANYAASKAAQVSLVKVLAKEVARKKITVNAIAPGFIETEMIEDLSPEVVNSYKQEIPMNRFGTPEEVASSVLFLASKEASYITGTVLEIGGGLG